MAELLGKQDKPTSTQVLEHRVRELTTLHEIARAVTSVLDLEAVLNRIVEAGVYLTNAEEGFLLLVDEETGDLTLRAGKGLREKAARGMSMKVTDSIAGQVVKTGRPVRIGGFQRDKKYKVKTGYLVTSLVNVPIKSAGRVIGVLSVDHSTASMRTFSDHDVALLSSLADYAAIAIENARLFAEASAKASELATALEEQTGVAPVVPSPEQDRHALEQFAQGLRAQREEVLRGAEKARELAQNLRIQSESAEEVAERLSLWTEEVLNLLPQLEWLAQSGLGRDARPPSSPADTLTLTDADALPTAFILNGSLLKHLAEGVLLCDATGVVRQANEAAARILGKPVAELVNSDLQTVVDDPRWQRMTGALRLGLVLGDSERPMPPSPEARLYISGHPTQVKLVPIYESETEVVNIIAIFQSIAAETESKRAADRVLAALSQKLRSPMTAIASYSDLLLGDTVGVAGPMQRRYLQRIQQGIERLESILHELDSEALPPTRQSTSVSTHSITEVVNEALETAQAFLSLDGVSIVKDIDDDLPPVQIDLERVSCILTDLLLAAGKRTTVGDSVSMSVHVQTTGERPRHLIVLIRDGGVTPPGVPSLEEDEVIHTARSLAEDEGGRIWVDRKPDGNSLVSFLLPIAGQALPDHHLSQ